MMQRMMVAVAVAGLLGWTGVASATWVDIEGSEPAAFEESPLGSIEAPWQIAAGFGCPNDDTHVYEGQQSVLLPVGNHVISNNINLGDTGTYEFMFYDDMSTTKQVRAGVHYSSGPYTAPRLGALAVECNQSTTHYVAHRRWSIRVTSIERSEGWHKMTIDWYPGGVAMYVDDELATEFSDGYVYSALAEIIGAPYGTSSPAWIDAVPEPATLTLLGLGGLVLCRRRV